MSVDLPAPLSPMIGEHLARVELEAHPVEADDAAERLDEAAGPEDRACGSLRPRRRARGIRCDGHLRTFRIHWSTETATMMSTPTAKVWQSTSSPASERPLRKTPDDEGAEQGAPHGAATAEEARAADDDGGDRVEVEVDAGVGRGGVGAADLDPGADREDRAGGEVHAHEHAVDADAGEARRLGVVADGVDVPAPRGLRRG